MAFGFGKKNEVVSTSEVSEFLTALLDKQHEKSVALIRDAVNEAMKSVVTELLNKEHFNQANSLPLPRETYVVDSVKGTEKEKQGNEIISTLYDKLGKTDPFALRTFYVACENHFEVPIYKSHKERMAECSSDKSKFPNRKIDTVLILLDADEVLGFAKDFEFKKSKPKLKLNVKIKEAV